MRPNWSSAARTQRSTSADWLMSPGWATTFRPDSSLSRAAVFSSSP